MAEAVIAGAILAGAVFAVLVIHYVRTGGGWK